MLPAGFIALPAHAQPTTLGGNNDTVAVAYCWRNSGDYYFCYGPVQRTSSGETLDDALEYSGCYGADPQDYWSSVRDIYNGVWYICHDMRLESYHNSESRIRRWLDQL
jgi:hypothetical protein